MNDSPPIISVEPKPASQPSLTPSVPVEMVDAWEDTDDEAQCCTGCLTHAKR